MPCFVYRRSEQHCGPAGHALAEMMHAFLPDVRCYAADGFRTIEGLRRWIASE